MQQEDNMRERITFDPDKAFLALPIVQCTLGVILILALASTLTIALNDKLHFTFNSEGFNSAAAIFRVPIGLLTLSIPALALLAANHRSEQTKKQMSLTRNQIARTDRQIEIAAGQNTFSNYFKHLEEFEKRFKKENSQGGMHVTNPHKLHSKMFPRARQGDLTIDIDFYRTVKETVATFISECERLSTATPGGAWEHAAFRISTNMKRFFEVCLLNPGVTSGMQVTANKNSFVLKDGNLRAFISHFIEIFAYIDNIMAFDQSYETPGELKKLMKIDIEVIPVETYMVNRDLRFPFRKLLELT